MLAAPSGRLVRVTGGQGIEVSTYLKGKLKRSDANITVVIDGEAYKVPFGTPFIETTAGSHSVSVYWGAQPRKARPATDVVVPDGGTARVRWDGPRWIWQTGKLSMQP